MEGAVLPIDEAIARVKGGEAAAFGPIYERFSRPIHSYLRRVTGSQSDADDLTQETFLRAYQNIHKLRDDTRLESWLYSIASNVCFDLLRRRRIISWLPLQPKHEERADKGDILTSFAEGEVVQQALSQIPPKYASCLILRTVEGFSCDEIAEILNISKGAVWTRLSRAREMFSDAYEKLNKSQPICGQDGRG